MVRRVLLAGVLALLGACGDGGSDRGSFTVTVESVEVSKSPGTGSVEVGGLPAEGRTLIVDPDA